MKSRKGKEGAEKRENKTSGGGKSEGGPDDFGGQKMRWKEQ